MAITATTLFRMGNAGSPMMDKVRQKDIVHYLVSGVTWVQAGTGGVSTSAVRAPYAGRWWRLDPGYDYGRLILVYNDWGRHWSWQPISDMPLDDYKTELRASHGSFVRI